ncbi:MIND complex subunit NSL1 [Saccharomyces paradoxus]|uniref:MIND complex subunit NSL1 n=1 Tax=Saccharomyces paradoxus TaxID=27291 RepID=A0A8B8V0J5_SACPA|nr:Nsl1 [Saccharomyces paradoxus]QHS76508.1 Nsl1 [Saccharomyces paradoxus]
MSQGQSKKLDVTVEQLRSIYHQFHDILEEKTDLHLPKKDHDDDAVRREVQIQLQEFLLSAMTMASKSLEVVNADIVGKTVKQLIMESQEKYMEPFDLDLNEQVRKMYQEWEDETVKVAQLRQTGPAKINEVYNNSKDEYLTQLDGRIGVLQARMAEQQSVDHNNNADEADDQIKWEHIKDDYGASLNELYETQQDLPQVRYNVEKVRRLMDYLEKE